MSQAPLIRRAALSGRVFVFTKYKHRPDGLIEVVEKFDVTDQIAALGEPVDSPLRDPVRDAPTPGLTGSYAEQP